ncbi:Leucine rich repeat-containing protein [Xylanibacter ruminicola]|uniref:Leucine rich repeat-containing protein n=1 Tax=Xylanibacter ruminicola TaxID=839 RepID=A0A1M7GVZ2_XYLRU|nr:leucine-rich repeat protein [Xylanibacter ruminicola]SHM20410.1 Leucine rich repeat-containing protein [Xylanibacter ruminicola]
MKKIILLAIGILTSVTMMADTVKKNYQYQSMTYEYNIDTKEATLTFGGTVNGEEQNKIATWTVKIPKFIKVKSNETEDSIQYKVTRIGKGAFQYNQDVNHLIIPDEVTTIEEQAFLNMSNLRLIELPEKIGSIANNAFQNCNSLTHIGCKNQNPLTISPSIFGNKDKCMMLYVPAGFALKNEENWIKVFEDRIYEGDMVIRKSPDEKRTYICAKKNNNTGIATLFEWKNGENDTDITISASFPYNNESYVVKNIGSNVFTSPQFIKILSIEEGITRICNQAFKNCQIMRRITLPSTLNYIGSDAFLNCSYISHICCKVSDPFTLSEYSSRFPKNEMMTLYVPTSSYMNGSYPWFELFKGRIYQGEMNVVPDNGMTYIVASDSYEATLYEITDKNVVNVNFSIPNNVTGIDRQAFLNCTKISSLKNIPNTVTAIGPDAFKNCSGLEEIKLPSSLKMIGAYAFSGCSKLVRVESEIQNLFNIRDDLFTNANGNEKILYHANSSFGSEEEFKGWKNGFTYKLKGTRKEIRYTYEDEQHTPCIMTFTSASNTNDAVLISVDKTDDVNKIEVPSTIGANKDVNVIGIFKEAFSNASNLEQLAFENGSGILRIGKEALKGCTKLRILKLPSHLNKLGSMAFSSNGKLAHILFKSFNNSTSIIGSDVFGNYTKNNATIYIPSTNYIDDNKKDLVEKGWNMDNIIVADILEEFNDVQNGMRYIGWKKDAEGSGTAKLTKGVKGSSETEFIIGPTATSSKGNTYNVTAIAGEAFKSIGAEFKNLTISEEIKEIGISAFQGCSKIERIVLPTTLSKIGESAFSGCNNLADIKPTLGEDSLKITEIGASAFYNCTSLEKITLPSTLESIGLNAFAGCSKLTEIESFIETLFEIDETVFPNYSATLYVPCESRDAYLNAPVWKNFTEKHISAGERKVYEDEESGLKYAYASCGTTATLIKSDPIKNNIVIRDSIGSNIVVTEIAASALKDQKNIESVIIPEGVTSIGASAFENCTKLNKIELPKSLVSIGDQAFGNCGNIKMIISKILCDNLSSLTGDIKKVFTSDRYPDIKPEPNKIYIPVGEQSKETYIGKWNIFNENNFVVGYPVFDELEDHERKWRYDYLTTVDEESVEEEEVATTLYGTATLIKATNRGETDDNLIIPDTVRFSGKKYQVTVIGDNAFNDYPEKSSVVTLKISENIDSIGKYAFNGFSGVQKIWLPSSLKLIKEWAFNGCNKITHVCSQMVNPQPMSDKLFPSIPTNNTATLFIPSEVGYKNDSWKNFSNLIEGTFVNDYKEDDGIIYSCYTDADGNPQAIVTKAETNYIKEALIKDSVTLGELEEETNDKIYYKITSIGKYAFQLCTQLETLELPLYLEAIGSKAFVNSPNIKTIISQVPGGVVGSLSDNITNVFSIPSPTPEKIYVPTDAVNPYKEAWKDLFTTDNTKYIVGYPGYDGKGENGWLYDYITVDNKAIEETQNTATLKKAIQSAADENHVLPIPSEVTISEKKYKVTKIGDNAFNGYEGKNSDVELNIPETIIEIGKNAFYGFSKLEKVRLLKSLKSIGSMAFSGCSSITHVCSEMESPIMGDDVFSTPSPTATFFVPTLEGYNTNILDKFPNVVVGKFDGEKHDGELKYSCYTDADGNPKAILTKSETSIQEALIKDTVKISEEGDDFTVTTIGKNAFKGCGKLKKLVLPSTLISIGTVPPIGDNAFEECVVLDDIVSDIKGDDLKPIPTNVFSEYTRNNAKLYVLDNVTKYKETEGWDVFKQSNPDNYIVGKWVDSEVQVDGMQYRYHTGNHDAIVIKIDFPNNEHKTLPIKREVRFDNDPVTYLVSTIAPTSITNKERIDTIIIENGISTIEADAFKGCTNLKKVEFPSSLTAIGNSAFQGCTNLQKIWLPAALVSIGSKAFNGCNLTRINCKALPDIDKDVFSSYSAYLFVPKGTSVDSRIGWGDFARVYEGYYLGETTPNNDKTYICLEQEGGKGTAVLTDSKTSNAIKSPIQFKIDENNVIDCDVTIIGESAFNKNKHNLEEWNKLPSTVEVVEANAFKNCNLKSLELPATLKSIGDYAFSGNNIETLELPSTLTTIGDGAFKNCTNLNKMELPKNITTLGAGIFEDCSGLTEVISKIETKTVIESNAQSVPNAILYVPDGTANRYSGWDFLYTLEGDSKLARDVDGLDYAYTTSENSGNKAILIGVTKISEDGAVTIPESVTIENLKCQVVAIGKDVFNGNLNLKKLEIKAPLASIGENAFSGCSNLSEIICDKYYKQLDALSQFDVLLYVPNETIKKSYVDAGWNSNHVYVGERQEKELGGLVYAYTTADAESSIREAVLVGATAEAISENGAVTIPGSIKFKVDEMDEAETEFNVISIANSVFSGNTKVKLLTIGEQIKSIGEHAFDGCTNLKEVVSKITDENVIGSISFSQPGTVLYVPEAALVDAYKAWNFTYTLVGERKVWNKDGLYYLCATGDKKAILVEGKAAEMRGDELTITGSIAFKVDEKDEAETTFDVIAIADEAFKGNTDIKNLKIEENIETIGASAFQGCLGLNKIWLPASLVCLKDMAFYGCSNMAYIGNASATPLATVGANVFPKTTSTLYVPFGAKEAYTESSVWGAFSKVKEGTFVDAVNVDGLTFECIVNDKNEKVTQLVKAASSLTEVVIPSEVQNGDATYRVTAIDDKAFEACTKLTVITSKISKENLFEFKKNVFPEAIYENATVYAPYDTDGSTEKKYRETEGWKYFEKYAKGEKKTAAVDDLTYEYIVGVGTATITKAATNISKVSIDGTVMIDGAVYTVKAIGANAFKGCNGLKVVWLPATLESIDKTAFSGCNGIAYVSSAIDNPTAADANIFPSSATLFVPQGRKSNYNIGGWNNFAYVGEGRFVDAVTASDMSFDCYTDNAGTKKAILKKYNVNAATVEIPGSVKVGNDAYTVSIITKQAFASKTNMESLIIPSGVETIEAEAFNACSKLKWIESKIVNPISISNVFANTNATLFIPSNNVSDYKARGWNFLNVFVGERKQTDVDGWTYVYSTGDKKAVLTRVGNVGTNVTINGTFKIGKDEYTVTSVGDAVFKGKSNIEALTIAKSIENIGANAFEGCVKLVSITCEGSSPAKLGADAFPSANVTVNVPNDAIDTYKNHADWKQFREHILGITTSVEDDPTGPYNIIVPAGGDATPEVEIWNGLDASGDVVIPEVVELNGSDYKVTGIAANAYDSNTDLTSIVIPSSITSIGASAFAGCTNLKSITVYCVTPINLAAVAATRRALTRAGGSSSVFEGVNKETCILYVPAESIDAYKQAEGWKDFKKIYAISATAINGIVISEGKPFDVYNLQGRKVKAHTTTFSGLPAGVYIVNGKKVMVK